MYTDATLVALYDAIHELVKEDVPFVVEWANSLNGAILELGCGSGRLLYPLAQAGHEVVGIDNAPEMLAKAKAYLTADNLSVALHEADMLHFDLPQKFAGILISYNTIMHITAEKLPTLWKNLQAHLIEGGQILIDTTNPLLLTDLPSAEDWDWERDLVLPKVNVWEQYSRYESNIEKQTIHVQWKFSQTGTDASLYTDTMYHYHYPHHLQMGMSHAGLQWLDTWGGYDRSAFEEESDRLLIVAGHL